MSRDRERPDNVDERVPFWRKLSWVASDLMQKAVTFVIYTLLRRVTIAWG